MNQEPEIEGEWLSGVPVLKAKYAPSYLLKERSAKLLSERLVEKYRELSKAATDSEKKACILVIASTVAGSPVVRAIFELYKVVHADGATLYCASYPENYMHSLTSLGLPALPGFKLTKALGEALELVASED
jgi:hypothetical protein